MATEHDERAVTLRDGRETTIRPMRPTDGPLLLGLLDHLSPESRYRRFLSFVSHPTDSQLHEFVDVDHHDHEALVALTAEGDMVGVARFVRLPTDAHLAEVAVTVVDDWQGDGLGTVLLERLAQRARHKGVEHFRALMLAINHTMMELFEELGPVHVLGREAGTVEVEIDLDDRPRMTAENPQRERMNGRMASVPSRI